MGRVTLPFFDRDLTVEATTSGFVRSLSMEQNTYERLRIAMLPDLSAKVSELEARCRELADAVEAAKDARDVWKETAETNDAANAPLRSELRRVRGERDEWARRHGITARELEASVKARTDEDAADVAELRNVIVSQAREIARLKGESE